MRFITFFTLVSLVLLSILTFDASAQEFQFAAEDFIASSGERWHILTPPFTTVASDNPNRAPELPENREYTITEAVGNAFIGWPDGPAACCGDDSWVKYSVTVPATGTWYLWALAVVATQADNSWFWGFDVADDEVVSGDADGAGPMNIWDVLENAALHDRYTLDWTWYPLVSRRGPHPGGEVGQYTADRIGVELSAGTHTLHFSYREHSQIDHVWATMEQARDPNVDAPASVNPQGKLAAKWGDIKGGF